MKKQLLCCFAVMYGFLASQIAAAGMQAPVAQDNSVQQGGVKDSISFRDDIRPILSNHCFQCHGPDENHRKAGLRLDLENDDIDFDEILIRITSDESYEIMPPPSANKELDEEKIRKLEQWVEEGATYETHWAFTPPDKINIPEGVHPVDFFVDQRLEQTGLARSAPADPSTLIRRLYLDMIGLPPTIEQADEYINNPTNQVYQRIVGRLLESPEYGERWARRWLDLARYADTNGYEKDRDRSIWPYRDWVIRAINDGMPFDQFSIEQIAGDMLPNATLDQRIATGFHRNTMLNEEGGIDPLEFRYYAMADRVATTGTTWLGLTLGCAQCHTHKFDPITHHDYFSMMAYLDNTDEPDLYIPKDDAGLAKQKNEERATKLLTELAERWPAPGEDYQGPTYKEAFQNWISQERQNDVGWTTLQPRSLSSNSPYLTQEADGIIYAGGDTTKHDVYQIEFTATSDIQSLRLEALPDRRHPASGPGMTYYEGTKGDFFLSEFRILDSEGNQQTIKSASETYAKNQFGSNPVLASQATDGDFQTGWSIYGRPGIRHIAVFNFEHPVKAGSEFSLEMHFGRHFSSSLGKFRLSATSSQNPVKATTLDFTALKSLSDKDKKVHLSNHFLLQAPQLSKHSEEIYRLKRQRAGGATLVMQERPAAYPRETRLRHRGEFTSPRDIVSPRLPDSLFQANGIEMPKNRLEFAHWLVSRENPLTARVVANRQWAAFFGTGLVKTVDDFGFQGDSPSHPELLDYLAVELMEQKWSIKKLHRLIVTSQTYRQSSIFDPKSKEADNRLLLRFPRNRLEGELIRDSALQAAGLLNKKMHGPPVRPLQPDGAAANFSRSTWKPSKGADRFRRSIYTYQKRTAPFAMLTTFDAPSGESCIAKRDTSNTPLQALTLMNDPMFMEIAEAYGKRMANAPGDNADKIEIGFRWLLTRKPTLKELKILTDFFENHRDWTALARAMLCLDEAVTKN